MTSPMAIMAPVASARGMNSRGGMTPALRMTPATQRLEGDEEPVAQVDLRLVLRDDLAPLGGETQFSCQSLLL